MTQQRNTKNDKSYKSLKSLKLGEILVPVTREGVYSEKSGHCVSCDGLTNNPFKFKSAPVDFPQNSLDKHYSKFTQTLLLISLADGLRFSFCSATTDNPVFVSEEVQAYRIERNDICCEYLVYQLSLKFQTGISQDNFLSIKIEFPSFNDILSKESQKNEYKLALREYRMSIVQEYDLQEMIDEMKQEFINEVRMRKHDMGSHLSELASIKELMEIYLERINEPHFESHMKELVNTLANELNKLYDSVSLLTREEAFGKPERINIDEFLYDYWEVKPGHGEDLDYDRSTSSFEKAGIYVPNYFSEDEWEQTLEMLREGDWKKFPNSGPSYRVADAYVNIAPEDLRIMLDTIIDNARRHGFSDDESYKNIFIQLFVDASCKYFIVDIFNNGKPLPCGMNKELYGLKGEKAGENAHTGLGGYRVKSIVEHYGGDYNIEDVYDDEGLHAGVSVKLYLPITK